MGENRDAKLTSHVSVWPTRPVIHSFLLHLRIKNLRLPHASPRAHGVPRQQHTRYPPFRRGCGWAPWRRPEDGRPASTRLRTPSPRRCLVKAGAQRREGPQGPAHPAVHVGGSDAQAGLGRACSSTPLVGRIPAKCKEGNGSKELDLLRAPGRAQLASQRANLCNQACGCRQVSGGLFLRGWDVELPFF